MMPSTPCFQSVPNFGYISFLLRSKVVTCPPQQEQVGVELDRTHEHRWVSLPSKALSQFSQRSVSWDAVTEDTSQVRFVIASGLVVS